MLEFTTFISDINLMDVCHGSSLQKSMMKNVENKDTLTPSKKQI